MSDATYMLYNYTKNNYYPRKDFKVKILKFFISIKIKVFLTKHLYLLYQAVSLCQIKIEDVDT